MNNKINDEIKIFVLNCGSSSLKYKMIAMPSGKELFGGEVQRIASKTSKPSRIVHEVHGNQEIYIMKINDYKEAFKEVMNIVHESSDYFPDVFAHRLVKGGEEIQNDSLLNDELFLSLDKIKDLAPIHNPPIIELIKECRVKYPSVLQAIVLDSTFHLTIPDYAYTYPLPKKLCNDLGIKKYGFHGISHQFVSQEAAKFLGIPVNKLNAISCHLGSGGSSLCAIKEGMSIDNSMGFSPMQGLVMSTRCGNLDPAVILRMLAYFEGNFTKVNNILNKKSGVLGLSGISSDIRDVIAKSEHGDTRAMTTLKVYLWRIKKYLGSYLTLVGNVNAIIFTDTIGELIPTVREAICKDMEFFGIKLDKIKNTSIDKLPSDISAPDSKVKIIVIKTDEELAIARRTYQIISKNKSYLNLYLPEIYYKTEQF